MPPYFLSLQMLPVRMIPAVGILSVIVTGNRLADRLSSPVYGFFLA